MRSSCCPPVDVKRLAFAKSYGVALVLSALGAVTSTVLLSDTTSAVLLGSVAAGWLEQEDSRAPSTRAGPASHKGRQESGFIGKGNGMKCKRSILRAAVP